MSNLTLQACHKTVIINRAVSGSGKTTLARCVTDALRELGLTVAVHSTDDFFMRDGRYVFELEKLSGYHAQNLANFTADLERGTDVVICDNMNLLPWQSQPYTDAARKYNYRIIFLNFLPRELKKHLAAQVVTSGKPDAHGLSEEILKRFIQNFHDYNDLLDTNTVRDIKRHHVFIWNDADNVAMDTGTLAPYFDSDAVITIRPDEYQELKNTLGEKVLNLIVFPGEDLKMSETKKHYLLTWYGITDTRAALGLEPTDGPVLGALRTRKYTDVIILGYTNPNKPTNAFSGALRAEWEQLCSEPLETRLAYPRNKAQAIVDAVCNTETGHAVFSGYIKNAGLPVRVQFVPQVLSHLNDAHAIDKAAREALRLALEDQADKDITCFLSPGTPVMAYTWAIVSRTNPSLNLRVISSSEPRKPPEEIDLPKELLVPVVSAPQHTKPSTFDVIIHLLGRERMPIYFAMLQFQAKEHIFITTKEFEDAARVLGRLRPERCKHKIVTVLSPFNPEDTRKAIEKQLNQFPSETKISINLTGGTKLMFAGALSACWERGLEPFYFEIGHHNVIFIRDGSSIPFIGAKSVSGFFIANGFDIVTQGRWTDNPFREARSVATPLLWKARQTLGDLYHTEQFRKYEAQNGTKHNPSFEWAWGEDSWASFNGRWEAELFLDSESIPIPDCDDFGQYLGGGWLEEYVFSLLRVLEQKGAIFDLRIGMEVSYMRNAHTPQDMSAGEFDCTFTDGKRLWIVECKAGAVKQEHIQKLENNLKTYGGIAAKGILVSSSSSPIKPPLLKRISASTSIRAVQSEELSVAALQRIISS